MGLNTVIMATMKPPMAEMPSKPNERLPLLMAFHAQSPVADRMARSKNVLAIVPCTVVVVLRVRGAP